MNQPKEQPKLSEASKLPDRATIRRELGRVQRQLEGLSKAVKRLKEAT